MLNVPTSSSVIHHLYLQYLLHFCLNFLFYFFTTVYTLLNYYECSFSRVFSFWINDRFFKRRISFYYWIFFYSVAFVVRYLKYYEVSVIYLFSKSLSLFKLFSYSDLFAYSRSSNYLIKVFSYIFNASIYDLSFDFLCACSLLVLIS